MDDVKVCRGCNQPKPGAEFTNFVGKGGKVFRRARCLACRSLWVQKWRAQNPEKAKRRIREDNLRKRLGSGFSLAEYERLLAVQGGACAICKGPQRRTYRGRALPLDVDHDHATGRIRGLLCNHCNAMIGYARDDRSRLIAAAEYLAQHSAAEVASAV